MWPNFIIPFHKFFISVKGIIPENSYLILGNLVSGSIDSTTFGLIDKGDILGKAELIS